MLRVYGTVNKKNEKWCPFYHHCTDWCIGECGGHCSSDCNGNCSGVCSPRCDSH